MVKVVLCFDSNETMVENLNEMIDRSVRVGMFVCMCLCVHVHVFVFVFVRAFAWSLIIRTKLGN